MKATGLLYLTMFFNIYNLPRAYCQAFFPEPEKHLLIKNKIKKYECEGEIYWSNSDKADTWQSTYLLNDFGSILSINTGKSKTIFEYVNDMVPQSKAEFKNNSNLPSKFIYYKYDSGNHLQEELEFDSLDNLIRHQIYNIYGKIIEELEYNPESGYKKTTKNKYNEQGDILESTVIHPAETTNIVFIYRDGLLIREESFINGQYKHVFIEYFIYNKNKQLISQHTRQKEYSKRYGEKFKLRKSIQYKYNHKGKRIKKRVLTNIKNQIDVDDDTGISIDDIIEGDTKIVNYEYNDMGLISNILSTENGKPLLVYSFKYFQ